MAKDLHPGKKNNLNALCERYGVNNSHRTLHGALLDAEILSEVYLAMTRGQESLIMDLEDDHAGRSQPAGTAVSGKSRQALLIRQASAEELAQHALILAAVEQASKGKCLWLQSEAAA